MTKSSIHFIILILIQGDFWERIYIFLLFHRLENLSGPLFMLNILLTSFHLKIHYVTPQKRKYRYNFEALTLTSIFIDLHQNTLKSDQKFEQMLFYLSFVDLFVPRANVCTLFVGFILSGNGQKMF